MVDPRTLQTVLRPPSAWRLISRAVVPRRRPLGIEALPELHLEEQPISRPQLERYLEVCEFPPTEGLPLSYLFVAGFIPQVMLVTDPAFPLKALGMVHVGNHFELFGPVETHGSLSLRVRALELETVAKGRQVKIETLFLQGGSEVARSVSTNFARGGGHGRKAEKKVAEKKVSSSKPPATDSKGWNLDAATGRRYAAASGDYNPIHLYPWSARLFGFRRPIAHGMYLVARALAEIESRRRASGDREPLRRLEARFKTPTFLPSQPKLFVNRGAASYRFELWNQKGDRPHLTGSCSTETGGLKTC